jgi:hypothetical protein
MIDETGHVYGRLTVLERTTSDVGGNVWWCCVCICGMEVVVRGYNLRSGHTRSCGCLSNRTRSREGHLRGRGKGLARRRLACCRGGEIRVVGDVAYVLLQGGAEALVDAADVGLVRGFRWLSNGRYVRTSESGRSIAIHRLIMGVVDGCVI